MLLWLLIILLRRFLRIRVRIIILQRGYIRPIPMLLDARHLNVILQTIGRCPSFIALRHSAREELSDILGLLCLCRVVHLSMLIRRFPSSRIDESLASPTPDAIEGPVPRMLRPDVPQ